MIAGAAEYLREVAAALESESEQELLAAVSGLIEVDPKNAAVLVWPKLSAVETIYARRVLSYAVAKTAASQPAYLWGPLSTFVTSPYTHDEATLVNTISALQLYDEHDDILAAVLAPNFGAYASYCLQSGPLVIDAFSELVVHLSDRAALPLLLSRAQVEVVRQHLAVASEHATRESRAALTVLRRGGFADILQDVTARLNDEEVALTKNPPAELNPATVLLLRTVLESARSSYAVRRQAQDVNGVVQEIRLTGTEPSKGRLSVDVFEKLVHTWKMAVREAATSWAPDIASAMTTYVLAPARGSFLIRFLIDSDQHDALSRSFEELVRIAESPEVLASETSLSVEAKSNIAQFLEVLSQKHLDATFGQVEPRMFEKPRRRVLSAKVAPAIRQIRASRQESAIDHSIVATLDGASHRQGTFEITSDELGQIRGDVPPGRRSLLLQKVIGRRYRFGVEERITRGGAGEERRQWVLESVTALDQEEISSLPMTVQEPTTLSSGDVPQQDRLDRIVAVVRLVAAGTELRPRRLGMPDSPSSERHIDYMRHGAKVLGLLAEDGTITGAGQALAQLPESRVMDFLSVQFELSVVGKMWKHWSRASDLHQLAEDSAVRFLLESGLSESMAERRGRTLRKWLVEFKSRRPGSPEPSSVSQD